jgi:ribosome maturation protein Sdo1
MDDDVIPRIKFIGKIQKGEKMNVKHMQIQQDTILTKIFRSFVYNDNRTNTFNFINTSIKKAFEILNMHMDSDKQFDKKICQNIINDLRQCRYGMINIKDTYMDDLMFCCKMDSLIEESEARINDIESKYEYLRAIEMDS